MYVSLVIQPRWVGSKGEPEIAHQNLTLFRCWDRRLRQLEIILPDLAFWPANKPPLAIDVVTHGFPLPK